MLFSSLILPLKCELNANSLCIQWFFILTYPTKRVILKSVKKVTLGELSPLNIKEVFIMKSMEQSRRDFLRLAGKGMVGAAALTAVPTVIAGAEEPTKPAWPWEYKPLDKEEVKAKVFANFNGANGGCCSGVASGILDLMAEKYGYPYNQIDGHMFANGGGGYGRKNLCGSLGGALAVIGLFCESKDSGAIRNQLYAWYESTTLPMYVPEGREAHVHQTVAGSELCKDSVGNWMAASGCEFASPERGYRCGCLSADVAAKTIELLNIHFGFEAAPVVEEEPAPALAANEYIGTAVSEIGGELKVKVTMDGANISKIEVLSNGETPDFFAKVNPTLLDNIVKANGTTGVDTITGATKSSEAIIAAVNDALSQIKK